MQKSGRHASLMQADRGHTFNGSCCQLQACTLRQAEHEGRQAQADAAAEAARRRAAGLEEQLQQAQERLESAAGSLQVRPQGTGFLVRDVLREMCGHPPVQLSASYGKDHQM